MESVGAINGKFVKGVDIALSVPRAILRVAGKTAEFVAGFGKKVGLPIAAGLAVDGWMYGDVKTQFQKQGALVFLTGPITGKGGYHHSILGRALISLGMDHDAADGLMEQELALGLALGTVCIGTIYFGVQFKNITYSLADALKLA